MYNEAEAGGFIPSNAQLGLRFPKVSIVGRKFNRRRRGKVRHNGIPVDPPTDFRRGIYAQKKEAGQDAQRVL
jgi:hypothetical protein